MADTSATSAITLRGVTKRYRDVTAVSVLNLNVQRGEILGFLGPNGAGKTTTIRILLGFLRPTRGSITLLGHDMAQSAPAQLARRRLGFVPDVAGLDPSATGEWLLDELARLQQRPCPDREKLIAALDLAPRDLRRPMGRLSRGTRQKINIVQGLQHRPELLILDEPTEGLDPLTKRTLFALLRHARERGTTIFFSSHILSEVEALCDRVALIRQGSLVAVNGVETLRAHMQRRVTLELSEALDIGDRLRALPTVRDVEQVNGRWQCTVRDLPPLLRLFAALPVADVTIEPASLEEIFLQFYRPQEPHNG